MHRFTAVVTAAIVLAIGRADAGQYNQVLSIGDAGPKWKDLIGVDDDQHSLDDLRDAPVVVVVFTCNSCPYSVDAEDRLIALTKKYRDQDVAVVAINVNKVEADRLPAMKERAESKKFPFPYLFDETQQIARRYGAIYTPECFVLDRQRRVTYMGSIDDSPDGKNVTMPYLELAIEASLAGQRPAISETIPIGCRVRYERNRRRRVKGEE